MIEFINSVRIQPCVDDLLPERLSGCNFSFVVCERCVCAVKGSLQYINLHLQVPGRVRAELILYVRKPRFELPLVLCKQPGCRDLIQYTGYLTAQIVVEARVFYVCRSDRRDSLCYRNLGEHNIVRSSFAHRRRRSRISICRPCYQNEINSPRLVRIVET